jgi:hypothetical protein
MPYSSLEASAKVRMGEVSRQYHWRSPESLKASQVFSLSVTPIQQMHFAMDHVRSD